MNLTVFVREATGRVRRKTAQEPVRWREELMLPPLTEKCTPSTETVPTFWLK